MKKEIKVFVADASEDFRTLLADAINEEEGMRVCGTAENGMEALELLDRTRPDVLVTDLILRGIDGIEMLKKLRDGEWRVHTIVVSGFFSDRAAASISCLGVDYYFPKPCRLQEILHRIREIGEGGEAIGPALAEFDPMISEALMAYGIIPNHLGYRYLREAIRRTMLDPNTLRGVTKILYPDLAKMNHSTARNVERAIRHAIEAGWKNGDVRHRNVYFGENFRFLKRPTNSTFIAMIAEYVTRRYLPDEMGL